MKAKCYLFLTILVTCFILLNSCLPANESQELSMGLVHNMIVFVKKTGIQLTVSELDHIIRKFAHFTEFASHGFLVCGYLRTQNHKWWYAGVVGLLTAIVDESLQLFAPGRNGQISDILLDWAGCWCGVLAQRISN